MANWLVEGQLQRLSNEQLNARGFDKDDCSTVTKFYASAKHKSPTMEKYKDFHLFTHANCPWTHRVSIYRRVKFLEEVVGESLAYSMDRQGWLFKKSTMNFEPFNKQSKSTIHLHEVYQESDPTCKRVCCPPIHVLGGVGSKAVQIHLILLFLWPGTCKVTMPVLWDKVERKIVSNDSNEIIRILNR
jgi:putative glutathione S-transferase